jgi:hypothetical protein
MRPPPPLRSYSGFIALYPIGVASELTMAWLALPELKRTGGFGRPARGGLAAAVLRACIDPASPSSSAAAAASFPKRRP